MLLALLLFAPQAPPEPEAPRARGWSDFPVFVWRERYAGKPLPEELVEPFGGVILMRDEDSAWARARGLSYLVWNAAGRDALHLDADETWNRRVETWIETRDEALLVREPCLNDPATIAGLHATLARTIAKHGEHPGLGFVLGDEVSLTPNGDPFDLCRCGHCEARWREYAKVHGWPERAPLTDEVRSALLEDDFSLLGAWLARRRFGHDGLVQLLRELAGAARGERERSVALLGLRGRTAFGGLDVLALKPFIDVLEGYACADTQALLASRRPSGTLPDPLRRAFPAHDASVTTLFLAHESPAGAAWLAWEGWMRGADALVLWEDSDLVREPARAARLAEAVRRIRALRARFPGLQHARAERVELLSDPDWVSLAWLRDALLDGPTWPRRRAGHQDEHGTREGRARRWREAADELGITLGGSALDAADGCGSVWIALDALVLGDEDLRNLEKHLASGGTLLVDGPLGWVDRHGVPRSEDALARLRARAPERVVVLSEGEKPLALLRRMAADPEAASVSVRTRGGARDRWLTTRRSTLSFAPCFPGGVPLLAAFLPITRTPEERARLEPALLEVDSALEIEWIHPREGEPLPAGDAAVFLLSPPAR